MTDDQDSLVSLAMFGEDFPQETTDSFPRVAHRFSTGESDIDPSAQIFPALVKLVIGVADLIPQHVFVIAEVVFAKL